MTEPNALLCFAAKRLGIPEVMDATTGEIMPVQQVLMGEHGDIINLRNRVATGLRRQEPVYRCPLCGSTVRLNCMKVRRLFYFKHTERHSECPWHTGANLTREELLAWKFQGAKESAAHRAMKDILRQSLELDPAFAEPEPERVWKGRLGDWRKPDITTARDGLKIAMEVQLATTFLDVIVARREFYLNEAALLLWVFRDLEVEARRLTVDDVFYPNNRNAFIAGKHTLEESRRQGRFILECRWLEPVEHDGQVIDEWRQAFVGWSELTVDLATQRIYHFDYDNARAAAERALIERRTASIRERFERFWLSGRRAEDNGFTWIGLRADFANFGIELPRNHFEPDFQALIDQLLSAKLGRPVGYHFEKLVQVAHLVHDHYPRHLWWFGQLLRVHQRQGQVSKEDVSEKWKKRSEAIRKRMRAHDPALAPEDRFRDAVLVIFPELSGHEYVSANESA